MPSEGLPVLPYEPLEYVTRQAQGDWCVLDQRDGTLWMDAGMVTTQADWSLDFDLGMNFTEWHGPVPLAHETSLAELAIGFPSSAIQRVCLYGWTRLAAGNAGNLPA